MGSPFAFACACAVGSGHKHGRKLEACLGGGSFIAMLGCTGCSMKERINIKRTREMSRKAKLALPCNAFEADAIRDPQSQGRIVRA